LLTFFGGFWVGSGVAGSERRGGGGVDLGRGRMGARWKMELGKRVGHTNGRRKRKDSRKSTNDGYKGNRYNNAIPATTSYPSSRGINHYRAPLETTWYFPTPFLSEED